MNIQLPTGKTVYISMVEFLSVEDRDVDIFFQSLIADDSGDFIENPFSAIRPQKEICFDLPEIDFDEEISI